jgi:subtilisin family serine protease
VLVFGVALATASPSLASGRLLVEFRAGAERAPVLRQVGAADVHRVGRLHVVSLRASAPDALPVLRRSPAVVWAERDARLRELDVAATDPFAGPEYNWWLPLLGFPHAWSTTMGSSSTVVAVVDSGVAAGQPDLAGALLPGYDFVDDDTDTSDVHGHGTAVAGLIAARANNGIGIAGGCPRCSILPVRVIGPDGTGPVSTMARGITWAADHGARVINVSIKAAAESPTLDAAVAYAVTHGAVVVAGAGNDGNAEVGYPAGSPGAIGVAASTAADARYAWSSYGTWAKVAAPGCTASTAIAGGVVSFCGTSAAAPIVSSLAGLLFSRNPEASPAQVENAIEQTARPLDFVHYGRVDAAAAIASFGAASPGAPAPAPGTPSSKPTGDVAPAITALVPAKTRVAGKEPRLAFAVIASSPGKLEVELSGGGGRHVLGLRAGSNRLSIHLPFAVRTGVHVLTLTSTSSAGVSGTTVQRRIRLYR